MLHFDSDYMEGAHPAVIERLAATNLDQTSGYGTDEVCESARDRIRTACTAPEAAVYFLVGGTQANIVALDQLLRPWEGVVAANTGHINGHEAGALEGLGHKILPLPHHQGKLDVEEVRGLAEAYWGDENRDHMVAPGVVYISQPTEYGTVYTLPELEALSQVCRDFALRLFVDGARLGYGLAAQLPEGVAVPALPDLAHLADGFYIGGTKVGALFGEAVVFPHPAAPANLASTSFGCRLPEADRIRALALRTCEPLDSHFFTIVKKRGALLAKGRMLGIQFDELFKPNGAEGADAAEDGESVSVVEAVGDAGAAANASDETRYLACGRHGVQQAQKLQRAFVDAGYELAMESPTNQVFPIFTDADRARLDPHATYGFWERTLDGRTVTRFACSWATRPEDVDALIALL